MALRVEISPKQPASLLLVGTGNGNDRRYVVAEFRSWSFGSAASFCATSTCHFPFRFSAIIVIVSKTRLPRRAIDILVALYRPTPMHHGEVRVRRKRTDVWRFVIVASLKRPLSSRASYSLKVCSTMQPERPDSDEIHVLGHDLGQLVPRRVLPKHRRTPAAGCARPAPPLSLAHEHLRALKEAPKER